MKNAYDQYYQTENLFGEAYPELIQFFANYPERGILLDLGCGQGRDAVPLARMGFEVTGIDSSQVGIDQMNAFAEKERLALKGMVRDLYAFDDFGSYDFILLDSMFHFGKKEKAKETALVRRIMERAKVGAIIVFCIQNTGIKVKTLEESVYFKAKPKPIYKTDLVYTFQDAKTGHRSHTDYRLWVVQK